MRTLLVLLSVVGWVVLGGCGGAASSGSAAAAVQFPSRATLRSVVARTEAASLPTESDGQPVASWTMDPASLAPSPSPFDALVAAHVRSHPAHRASPALDCAAREIARFYAGARALPTDAVRRFLAARCGSTATPGEVRVNGVTREGGPPMTDAELVASLGPRVEESLATHPEDDTVEVGVGLARVGDATVVAVAFAGREADLRVGPLAADGTFWLEGRVKDTVVEVSAQATHGALGAEVCVPDPDSVLPVFRLRCTLAPEDAFTTLQVVGRVRDRLVGYSIGQALVPRTPSDGLTWVAPQAAVATPVTDSGQFREALIAQLNALRAAAGTPPVTLSAPQSASLDGLVVPLLSAERNHDGALVDLLALGTLAGWEVGGEIRTGNLCYLMISGVPDAAQWLADAMSQPSIRALLMSPQFRTLGIGAAMDEGHLAALVGAYALFEEGDDARAADRVAAALERARRARGSASTRVRSPPGVHDALVKVRTGTTPEAAMQNALNAAAARTTRRVRIAQFLTVDVDSITFPSEFLTGGPMRYAVEVVHFQAPGAAWSTSLVALLRVD